MSDRWKTRSPRGNAIDYPPDWDYDISGKFDTKLLLTSPVLNDSDQFRENINLKVESFDYKNYSMNLDQFVELTENQIKGEVDSKIISSERIKRSYDEFHKLISTGPKDNLNLKYVQYIWVIGYDHEAYVLTYTCEVNLSDKSQELGIQIMDSFELQ